MTDTQLYSADGVIRLFDGMAATYGLVNLVASFGFCHRWRHQCVDLAQLHPGMAVYDLMSGMGECWPAIARRIGPSGHLTGVDFSPVMCARAAQTRQRLAHLPITQLQQDFLANTIPAGAADAVVSCFGLKTFSAQQQITVAHEIARILKPGGAYSLLEISVPANAPLRLPYMFYLKRGVPILGATLLGNPDHYRMLGRYTEAFNNGRHMAQQLAQAGLSVAYHTLFGGCATAISGRRPA